MKKGEYRSQASEFGSQDGKLGKIGLMEFMVGVWTGN